MPVLITTLSSSISLLCGFLMFLYLMHQIEVAVYANVWNYDCACTY